jgi:hypothetical protein
MPPPLPGADFMNQFDRQSPEVTILQSPLFEKFLPVKKFHKIDSCVLMPRQPAKDYLPSRQAAFGNRVTRLSEFSSYGRLFTMRNFFLELQK